MKALIPLRLDADTKTRLAGVLSAAARQRLAAAMAADVGAALAAAPSVAAVTVVDAPGVNAAVRRTVAATPAGAPVLVIHGDVPLMTAAAVDRLVAEYRRAARQQGATLGIVADARGTGTNALIVPGGGDFPFAFGPDSRARHAAAAAARGWAVVALTCPEAAFDIDTPADLAALRGRLTQLPGSVAPATRAVLADEGARSQGLEGLFAGPGTARPDRAAAEALAALPLGDLMRQAAQARDAAHGAEISYSRKVFLPLTHLCRDVCHYCTFAAAPRQVTAPYMSLDDVVARARAAAVQGCKEALFTLGEKPELRYRAARAALDAMGFASTLDYVAAAAARVLAETGLLPHINAGTMTAEEMLRLRKVAPSMGLMLESGSERLCAKGGPHHGSPDKDPAVRFATIAEAGRQSVPFTTGLLVGIGETRAERLDDLFALRDLHDAYGHIQELIIQNFLPKPGTRMAAAPAAAREEFLWTIAMARLVFGGAMNIQAPPNLNEGTLRAVIDAGINDWGGVSPVTPDYVNPEAPWPELDRLAEETAAAGKVLTERLTVYPAFARAQARWLDPAVRPAVLTLMDASGRAREDSWLTGISDRAPRIRRHDGAVPGALRDVLDHIEEGGVEDILPHECEALFAARGAAFDAVCASADRMRQATSGDAVTYVVNRNINYTNICTYRCQFCAFSKGKRRTESGDAPYLLELGEIQRRSQEAWARGATEVCLQGGIHPSFTGETYLSIVEAIRAVLPDIHIHAFSPLEVTHGARSLGLDVAAFLRELKDAGLNSLPGTAAEILSDDVRAIICPDKLTTAEWLDAIEAAHGVGLPTTATIMFGHVDSYAHWVTHLTQLRTLQQRTGGLTEFVPLPFVAHEAPLYRKGGARAGPTYREAVLMHAVARLMLGDVVANIQASWVKMGRQGAQACLAAGANDLGGTLMNESITRAAGARHGQEVTAADMDALARAIGRTPRRRTTLYGLAHDKLCA